MDINNTQENFTIKLVLVTTNYKSRLINDKINFPILIY